MTGATLPLSEHDGRALLAISESAIRGAFEEGRLRLPDLDDLGPALATRRATFVTLEASGQLLGCMGRLDVSEAVALDAARNAVKAAFADPRFPAHLQPADFEVMTIKVSVLGPLDALAVGSVAELVATITPGCDGLVVSAGRHRATLLPAVWRMFSDAESFVEALWHKAGLPSGRWPSGTVVERYGATEFLQPGPRSSLSGWRAGFAGR